MSARTEQVVSNAFGAKGSRDQRVEDRQTKYKPVAPEQEESLPAYSNRNNSQNPNHKLFDKVNSIKTEAQSTKERSAEPVQNRR